MYTRLHPLILALLAVSILGYGQQPPVSFESLVVAAQNSQARGNYAQAAQMYRQATALRPELPELWANLGLMQQETGDIPGAMQSFEHALRINPSLYVPNLFLGIDDQHQGKTQQAIPLLKRATNLKPSDPQAALALGRAYLSSGDRTSAGLELDRATRLDPKLADAWFTQGITLLEQVETDARRMSAQFKDSPFAGALYAESLQKQGRFGEAATLLKTLMDSQPEYTCLRAQLGLAFLRGHDSDAAAQAFSEELAAHPECSLAVLGDTRIALEKGDTAKATQLLLDLWKRDHGFVAAFGGVLLEGLPSERAESVARLDFADRAIPDDLKQALHLALDRSALEPVDETTGTSLTPHRVATMQDARQFYRAGQYGRCARSITSRNASTDREDLQLLSACAYLDGDFRSSFQSSARLVKLQPNAAEGLYWKIRAEESLAFQSLARFQELEPDSARSHVLLGDIYHHLERNDEAESEYEKALKISPRDPAGMLGLASVDLSNNNLQGAIATATDALKESPDDPELNLILAEALLTRHEYQASEPFLQRALHAKPELLPRVHVLMGRAFAETGRTQEAIAELNRGASSDIDGSVQYMLARLYRKLGETQNAMAALARMRAIKDQRRERGFKAVEDPDLSPLESSSPTTP